MLNILFAFFVVFSLLLSFSLYNQRKANNSTTSTHVEWMYNGNDRVFLLLPGILARGEEQFQTLIEGFGRKGSVDIRTYVGHGFDLNRVARNVERDIEMYRRYGLEVIIIGASIGGLVGFEALKTLESLEGVKLIMIDSPHGVSSMSAFPDRLAILTRIFKGAPLPNFIGNRVLEKMKVGPKRDYVDEDQQFEIVKEKALASLSGHEFSMWWAQLVSMVNYRPTPIVGLDVTYVACLGEANDVVVQPLAHEKWKEVTKNLKVVEVEAAHCGFLQQPTRWHRLFADAL